MLRIIATLDADFVAAFAATGFVALFPDFFAVVLAIALFAVLDLTEARRSLTLVSTVWSACARGFEALVEAPVLAAPAFEAPALEVLGFEAACLKIACLAAPRLTAEAFLEFLAELEERVVLFDTTTAWRCHAPVHGLFPGNPVLAGNKSSGNRFQLLECA
jgi:hypothetical protein